MSNFTSNLPPEITSNCTKIVNQYIQAQHIDITIPQAIDRRIFYLEKNIPEIIQGCNLTDTGLAAALCYYTALIKSPIPENIAITGGLDSQGRTLPVDSLDSKIETVLRELHFIDRIIIPKGSSCSIRVPENVRIIEVSNFEQTVDIVFGNDI